MATKTMRTAAPVETEEAEGRGKRLPDYTVLLRQQPQRGNDGKLYRSENMTVVGAAWVTKKVDPDSGEEITYIGIKAHIKFEVGEEGLLLRTYRENVKS
jgi:hypothetical protein